MKLIVGFCLAWSAAGLYAQQSEMPLVQTVDVQPKVHFFGSAGEGLLKLVGQTFTEDDQLQEIVLRNDSDTTISRFQLAWILYIPDGCGITKPGITRREVHLGPYEQHLLKPGETAAVGPYHLSSDSIAAFARNAQSPAIFVQVAVNAEEGEARGARGIGTLIRYGHGHLINDKQWSFFGGEDSVYPCQKAADGSLLGILKPENASDGFAETQPKAHFVTAAGIDSLKWTGQTVTPEDQLSRVILRNVSKKTITGFQLGWVAYLPDGCGVSEAGVPRRTISLGPFEKRTLKPGETATVGPYHLSSNSIAAFAVAAHSPAFVVQVGVFRVRYSDGSVATSDFRKQGSFGPEPTVYPCQANKTVDANVMKTFTSPDGDFQFRYSQVLIKCLKSGEVEDGWEPGEFCESQQSACGEDGANTLACLAYPMTKFGDTGPRSVETFTAAEVKEAKTKALCLGGPQDWPMKVGAARNIHGVKFTLFEVGSAWLGGGISGELYRTFHSNKCYELGFWSAGSNPAYFDSDETEKFTKEDAHELKFRLDQPFNSFRFLK